MLRTISEVLPEEIWRDLSPFMRQVPWKHGWYSRRESQYFPHWNCDFAGVDGANGLDISDRLHGVLRQAWEHINHHLFPQARLLRCYANAHTYGVEGYPHADSIRAGEVTLVVYCNQHWQRDWGGETMVYDNNTILHAQLPQFNTGLAFDSDQDHCARAVTRICKELRVTLMFKMATGTPDQDRDHLQLFLNDIRASGLAHSGGSLASHLLRTYDILKRHNQRPEVCMAGGAHSLLGTNRFASVTVSTQPQLDALRSLLGSESMALVDLFSSIDRPGILVQYLNDPTTAILDRYGNRATAQQAQDLIAIECANLSEQKTLAQHPQLAQWWQHCAPS